MNTMKHSLSSHKICTPMTMSISNRLCMHDLYLVKLQTYLLLIFAITNIISSDNHYFFEFVFPLFLQVTSYLIDLNKTLIFRWILILILIKSLFYWKCILYFKWSMSFQRHSFRKYRNLLVRIPSSKKWSTRLITSPLRAHTE